MENAEKRFRKETGGGTEDGADALIKRAANPNTERGMLREFAGHENAEVRAAVAENTTTPENLLAGLSRDGSPEVRFNIARRDDTPEEVFMELARNDSHTGVLLELAKNPTIPEEVATEIMNRIESITSEITQSVEDSRAYHGALFKKLHSDDPTVRKEAAESAETPPNSLYNFLKDEDSGVRLAAAGNPYMPAIDGDTVRKMVGKGRKEELLTIMKNRAMPEAVIMNIRETVRAEHLRERHGIGEDAAEEWESEFTRMYEEYLALKENLGKVTENDDPTALKEIARDRGTPEEVLDKLIKKLAGGAYTADKLTENDIAEICLAAAGNPNTSGKTLGDLVRLHGKREEILIAAVSNPKITGKDMEHILEQTGSTEVRLAAAGNPNITHACFEILLYGTHIPTVLKAAKNPAAAWERVLKGMESKRHIIMEALAGNPAVTPDILTALADHEDGMVRRAARERLREMKRG